MKHTGMPSMTNFGRNCCQPICSKYSIFDFFSSALCCMSLKNNLHTEMSTHVCNSAQNIHEVCCNCCYFWFLPCNAKHSAVMPQQLVHPSVCLSITFRYRDHIGWNTSKIISRLTKVYARADPNIGDQMQPEHP